MTQIIREQQTLINSLRAYSQEVEDLYKSAVYKLQTIWTHAEKIPSDIVEALGVEKVSKDVKGRVSSGRNKWIDTINGLEAENIELKQILDNMIKLVR